MWHNIAASKGSQLSAESRDGLALKMSADQTVEAQTMARECAARRGPYTSTNPSTGKTVTGRSPHCRLICGVR